MEAESPATAWVRVLLELPDESGERFPEEWTAVRRRIEIIHRWPVPFDTEPAVAPRPEAGGG
jgi:hypothetical protein